MPVEHKAAARTWSGANASDREAARYPPHNLKAKDKDGFESVVCRGVLILPAQVPIRDADPGSLYCVGCRALVAATSGQHTAAMRAAAAEGFTPAAVTQPPDLVPGLLDDTARAGLFWLVRLSTVTTTSVRTDAEKAIATATPVLDVLRLTVNGVLTEAGRAMALLVAEPPVDPRLARTNDPSLVKRKDAKRLARKKRIDILIPRCSIRACFQPLPRDGACKCGHAETSTKRLAEVARCWDIVDTENPVKPKREKKARVRTAEVPA